MGCVGTEELISTLSTLLHPVSPHITPLVTPLAPSVMPECSHLVALLAEYIDGRLPEDQRAELERHLGACPECVAFVRTFRSTVSLLQSLSEQDLPAALRVRLRAFLEEQHRS